MSTSNHTRDMLEHDQPARASDAMAFDVLEVDDVDFAIEHNTPCDPDLFLDNVRDNLREPLRYWMELA